MKKKKIIIIISVVLVLALFIGLAAVKVSNKNKEGAIEIKEITTGDFSDSVTVSGIIKSKNVVKVTAKDNIKLEKLKFKLGDEVKKGDKLFDIDEFSFKKQIDALESDIESGLINIEKLDTAKQVIASSDELISQAELALSTAKNDYEYAKNELEKNKQLFDIGAISKDGINRLERAAEMAKIKVDNASLDYAKIKEQAYVANANTANQNDLKELDKEMASNNVLKAKISLTDVKKHLKEIEQSSVADMSGTISIAIADDYEGNIVPAGTLLYEISDLKNMEITSFVKESDISAISIENEVKITGEGIKKDKQVLGKVSFISPVATKENTKNGPRSAVEIKIDIIEGADQVMAGFEAECEIISKAADDALLVSFDMIIKEDYKDFVFVVDEANIAHKREIVLGETSDFDGVVISGLEKGEMVVVNPPVTLKDGDEVNIKKD